MTQEIRRLMLTIVLFLFVTTLPYWFAYLSTPPDKQFMGVVINTADSFQYFAWMRAAQSQWLVANPLTPEPTAAVHWHAQSAIQGRLQALTGWDYTVLHQITRLIGGAVAVIGIYALCRVIFADVRQRWAACLIAVWGAGLGWILVIISQLTQPNGDLLFPAATYTFETNTFYTVMAGSGLNYGIMAALFGLVIIGQKTEQLRYAWLAGVLALVMGTQQTYLLIIVYAVLGLNALILWIQQRALPWYAIKFGVIVAALSIWTPLYTLYYTSVDPQWKAVLDQFDNAGVWTPPPLQLVVLLGISWLLALGALPTLWRRNDTTHTLLQAWFVAYFGLIYLPVNFQVHLLIGWQIVAAILAVITLHAHILPWLQRRFKWQSLERMLAVLLVLSVLPTNVYLLAWRVLDLNRASLPYYLPQDTVAALEYLESQVTSDDVVLASLDVGQFVPTLTGARSFVGHWAQTLDFFDKQAQVQAFFTASTTSESRQQLLSEYGVDYVLHTPVETSLGTFDPAISPLLREVFANDSVRIYAVQN